MSKTLITIFDLDGVLVDSVEYERAVAEQIVRRLSDEKSISVPDALQAWNRTWAEHSDDPRWHDYKIHCAALGVPDIWKLSHVAVKHLTRQMPHASDAMDAAQAVGECWLATDATSLVTSFKLHAAHISEERFQQIFTLDRCNASKGFDVYWKYLAIAHDFRTVAGD